MRVPGKDDLKRQEVTQAVVIADNFNQKFSPLTNNDPLILLPIANETILNFILQTLEDSGIQETFIFCCSHSQLIRNYVSSSRWSSNSSMSVNVISSTSFISMGDILRELDTKALIRSDFVLVNGSVISTFPLKAILEQHRQLRQTDKNCALTLVYRKALPKHSLRCKEHLFVVAVESASKRIRYYQRVNKLKSLQIPLEVFQENEEITVNYNLLDSFISICSPCVPPLFSDNFDYQTMDDFVKGLIVNEELLGNSMYIHVAESGYGANISNFCMYDAVSQDIMSRWTYPKVPDLFDFSNHSFTHSRYNIYKEPEVDIGMNCKLLKNVIVGRKTKIGANSSITNSVIGRNCTIGDNVTIQNSYLWEGVSVGNSCHLDTCLLADKVTLRNEVTVLKGCVLGAGVVIGDGISLPPLTKLQLEDPAEEDSFGDEDEEKAPKKDNESSGAATIVGQTGRGYPCRSASGADSDDDEDVSSCADAEDVWGADEVEEDEEEETLSSSSQILSAGESAGEDYDDEAAYFYNEVLESLQRGVEEKVKSENMILEINSSKHAYNVTMKEVNTLLIKALLRMPLEDDAPSPTAPQQYMSALKPSLTFLAPLVNNYIRSEESQKDCMAAVQDFMSTNNDLCPAVMKVLHFWYEKDILTESVILKWYNGLTAEEDNIKKQASAFVKWLQEADEESSDEEDDEEEED